MITDSSRYSAENYKQNRTCLRDDSTHALYLIFGTAEMTEEAITAVAEEIKSAALALSPAAEMEYTII